MNTDGFELLAILIIVALLLFGTSHIGPKEPGPVPQRVQITGQVEAVAPVGQSLSATGVAVGVFGSASGSAKVSQWVVRLDSPSGESVLLLSEDPRLAVISEGDNVVFSCLQVGAEYEHCILSQGGVR